VPLALRPYRGKRGEGRFGLKGGGEEGGLNRISTPGGRMSTRIDGYKGKRVKNQNRSAFNLVTKDGESPQKGRANHRIVRFGQRVQPERKKRGDE